MGQGGLCSSSPPVVAVVVCSVVVVVVSVVPFLRVSWWVKNLSGSNSSLSLFKPLLILIVLTIFTFERSLAPTHPALGWVGRGEGSGSPSLSRSLKAGWVGEAGGDVSSSVFGFGLKFGFGSG